jgi:hypothetical protein
MWSCKRKLNNEKSKYAGLAQQNGFDPTFYKKAQQSLTPAVDWLDSRFIGLGGLLLVLSRLFALGSVFWVGLEINK